MNLFILDEDHVKNAQYHCDKHMKMLLEAAQLLCTTFHEQDIIAPYRRTHRNHPSSIFTRKTRENFNWVISYAEALSNEYTFRYGKIHKSSTVVSWAKENADKLSFVESGLTDFALAMPEQYKTKCPIESYRSYYIGEKSHIFNWTKRSIPDWI